SPFASLQARWGPGTAQRAPPQRLRHWIFFQRPDITLDQAFLRTKIGRMRSALSEGTPMRFHWPLDTSFCRVQLDVEQACCLICGHALQVCTRRRHRLFSRVGPGALAPGPLTEPDLWVTHPALQVADSLTPTAAAVCARPAQAGAARLSRWPSHSPP